MKQPTKHSQPGTQPAPPANLLQIAKHRWQAKQRTQRAILNKHRSSGRFLL